MDPLIEKGIELINEAQKILVFSGAGMSTESGIPDFRSPGGVWDRYDPSDFYFQKIISDEKAREKYWQMSTEFYLGIREALPNRAHLALKELEDKGKLLVIVTQNVDGLHHKAGNSPDKIIEIHGTVFSVSCLSCKRRYERDEIEGRLRSGVRVPYCDDCSGILKPDTVSFGQAMPEEAMAKSITSARQCDLCIVMGSSLVVYPAASIPIYAAEGGAKLMIVNRDATPMDQNAHLVLHDSVATVWGKIMEGLETQ